MNFPPNFNDQQPQSSMDGLPMMEDQESDSTPIIGHFKLPELIELDEAQGGINIDPETKLRDYRPLSKFIQNPEIREAITHAFSQENKQSYAQGGQVEEIGRPTDPELEKLRIEGRHGDTELAIITPELLEMFTVWSGKKPTTNPETDCPEFFKFGNFFKSLVRVVGTALGPITGFLGSKLTGQSTGAALKNAGIGFALPLAAMAAPSIIGALGGGGAGAGGAGGFLGNLFSAGASGGGGGLLANLSSVGNMMPGMGGQAAMQGVSQMASQAAPQAAGQMGGGILGSLVKGLPLLGAGLMMAKGHQEDKRNASEFENKQKQESEAIRNRLGFNSSLKPAKPFEYGTPNFNISKDDYERGRIPQFFNYDLAEQHAAQGGAIRGNGKGQQDNIHRKIPDGSYIIDASTVSDMGDGSTEGGFQELDGYFGKSTSRKSTHQSGGGYINAMVSNGEYDIPPSKVSALGKGSNERGARLLDKLVKDVRKIKRNSGEKLPPKSKGVHGYLKRLKAA